MKNNNIYISTNLQFLRKQFKKTQKDIGDLCNKTDTAVSNWEKGIREPDATDLGLIANFFNITVDDIMFKDLRFEDTTFDELDILFDKHKDILTDSDKNIIKAIIEERKKEIDKELGED